MLILLSPSKTLDETSPYPAITPSTPQFLEQTEALAGVMRKKSAKAIGELMDISEKLAALNHARFQQFHTPFTAENARPAIFTFKGDVYDGLDITCFTPEALQTANQHIRMLSGFYGLLKPFDLIQPYRLEMGIRLKTSRGKNLYEFWGNRLTEALNAELAGMEDKTVINLASQEYFGAVNTKKLQGELITPAFKEQKGNQLKVIGLFAKRARGMMARHLVTHSGPLAARIQSFREDGYAYDPALSKGGEWVFARREAKAA